MTIDELCQKAGTEICHQVFQSDRWKWKDEDDLAAILKPIIAEARAQALEEAALWFAAPDTIKTWRAANVARKLRDMAECAREAGGTC